MSKRKRSTEWQTGSMKPRTSTNRQLPMYDVLEGNSESTGAKSDLAAAIESAIRHEYVTLDEYARMLQELKSLACKAIESGRTGAVSISAPPSPKVVNKSIKNTVSCASPCQSRYPEYSGVHTP